MDFTDRLKEFLTHPAKAFKAEQKTTVGNALKYGVVGLITLGILTAIIIFLFGSAMSLPFTTAITGASSVAAFFAILIFGFIGLLISSIWLHIWAFVFGGRKGVGSTVKTVFYAYSPIYILGWIPIINFFANIWYLALIVIGLTQLQKLSIGRAIGAVIVAIIIPLIIAVILLLWAVSLVGPGFLASMQQLSSV